MAVRSLLRRVLLLAAVVATAADAGGSSTDVLACPKTSPESFLPLTGDQCFLRVEPSLPLEVTGEYANGVLSNAQEGSHHSILFYASWCSFSTKFLPVFDALSSMFPQITHLAVEESSTMPSVLSRNGIHSFPALVLASGTTIVRYSGPKNLSSIVSFYERTTGLEPVAFLVEDQPQNLRNTEPMWSRYQLFRRYIREEPYLFFSVCFVVLKAAILLYPFISRLARIWRPNMVRIVGELSELFDRLLHIVDVRKLWSKIRLACRTRNVRKGASNARVWASSLASVSLGKPSPSR